MLYTFIYYHIFISLDVLVFAIAYSITDRLDMTSTTPTSADLTQLQCVCDLHPTIHPTLHPTLHPTVHPTLHPTVHHTVHPTLPPTVHPTLPPTVHPTVPVCIRRLYNILVFSYQIHTL